MQDVSPGVAIGSFVGGIFTVLKIVVEVLKWKNARRLREADRTIGPSIRPPPPPAGPLPQEVPVAVALVRAEHQIEVLSTRLADAERRCAEQETLNKRLVAEMERLRREGGFYDVARSRPHGAWRGSDNRYPVDRVVRPKSGPKRGEPGGGDPDR